MPPYLREPSGSVCWNCEQPAPQPISVTVQGSSGHRASLVLCRACHASVYLPLAAEVPEVLPRGGPGKTVLVVDDEPDIRWLVRHALEGEGYAVEEAANGLEALQALSRVEPNCVLLDMRMPVLDGWGFARELEARHLQVPVVVMTAAQDAWRWCDEIGAAACLPKPFDVDDLLDTVERVCTDCDAH